MGTIKKSMPDDLFQDKQWKHSPKIVECFSCGARGAMIGNSSGFTNIGIGYVCDKKVCKEKTVLRPVEP